MQDWIERYQEVGDGAKYATIMPWVICIASSLFFFYEFIQGNMFASIADDVMRDFYIEADKMTYLSSVYYVSNVLFLFVAGFLLDRFSSKKIMMLAMMLCILSTFVFAHAQSFILALICRFVTGIGSAFCFLGPIRIVSRWFPPKRMALVTGIIVTIAMSGGMLAQYPLTKLVVLVGWREALQWIAWLGIGMFLIMAVCIKDGPFHQQQHESKPVSFYAVAKAAYCNVNTLCAALYTSLMNMAIAVFGAMMGVLYVMQRLGVAKEDAALVNSMLFLGAIVGGPILGWWSDKKGVRIQPMKWAVVISFLLVLAILFAPVSLGMMAVLFFLLGFFTAAQVISYALVAESSPPNVTATAVSLISIMTQGGYVIYQNIFSMLLLWHKGMHMENGVPVYSLSDFYLAAMILPLGLMIAYVMLRQVKETFCRPWGLNT